MSGTSGTISDQVWPEEGLFSNLLARLRKSCCPLCLSFFKNSKMKQISVTPSALQVGSSVMHFLTMGDTAVKYVLEHECAEKQYNDGNRKVQHNQQTHTHTQTNA